MLNEKIKEEFLIEFGENIRKIRKQKNLTQTDLALRINGDVKKISRIERGMYNFGIASVLILAQALEINVCKLFEIDNIEFFQKQIWK